MFSLYLSQLASDLSVFISTHDFFFFFLVTLFLHILLRKGSERTAGGATGSWLTPSHHNSIVCRLYTIYVYLFLYVEIYVHINIYIYLSQGCPPWVCQGNGGCTHSLCLGMATVHSEGQTTQFWEVGICILRFFFS